MKVLVYGGTGAQAEPVVHALLGKGHTPLVFSRDQSKEKPQALAAAGATLFEGDILNQADTDAASQNIDAIALLIPFFMGNPVQAGQNAVQSAIKAGINHVVWNSSGVIFPEDTGNPAYDVRRVVKALLADSGIPHVILEPTVYAENLLGPWTAPRVKSHNQVAYPTPESFKIGWLPVQDMATAVVAALENKALAGKTFQLGGKDTLNGTQLAEAFSAGLGRKIDYYPMPPADFGKILDQIMGPGAGDAVAAEYQAIWDGHINPVMYADMDETLNELGVEFTSFVDWVKGFSFLFS